MKPSNVYEWMLLNVERLADAVVRDGKMDGPESGPILEEAQRYDSGGGLRNKARDLLQTHLKLRGRGNLLP